VVAPALATPRTPAAVNRALAVSAPAAGNSNSDFVVEAFAAPRQVAPGNMVNLAYTVYNSSDRDERVRLRLIAPPGWVLRGHDEAAEMAVEAYDELDGELSVLAPVDATPGTRVQLRLVAEIIGARTTAEGPVQLDVVRRGGLRPGQRGMQGSAYLGTRGADPGAGTTGTLGGSLELTGRISPASTLTLGFLRGPRVNQPPLLPFASQQADRYSADLHSPRWWLSAGNALFSTGSAISGPGLRVQGAALRRTSGPVVGELVAGQPMTFGGDAAGLMGRARLGLTTPLGVIALAASDVRREATSYLPATRVRGGGLDLQLAGGEHRLVARAGAVWVRGRADSTRSGFAGEGQYSFSGRNLNFYGSGRVMPWTITGAQLPGNDLSGDAGVRVLGGAWLVGRASTSTTHTYGVAYGWRTDALAGGVRVAGRNGARLDLRANYREFLGYTWLLRRTVTAAAGMPLGPLVVDASAEVGHQLQNGTRSPIEFYRGGLRWTGAAGYVSFAGSYQDYANGARNLRWDASASLKRDAVELDGGAWISRGTVFGANPGAWANLALPLGAGFSLITGGEYMRWTPATARLLPPTQPLPPDSVREEPGSNLPTPWRVTFGIRRALTLPLPGRRQPASARPLAARRDDR
jgi:hypothetical protein